MDFGALPPEINSGRMHTGPGRGSTLAAAAACDTRPRMAMTVNPEPVRPRPP